MKSSFTCNHKLLRPTMAMWSKIQFILVMSSEQLVIQSQKNEIRRLKEDMENMQFSLNSKQKQLQIQKRKGSQSQNHNNILIRKIASLEEKIKQFELSPRRQTENFSSSRETTNDLRQLTNETNQLKKELQLKEKKIEQLKKTLQKLSEELKEKDKKMTEKENLMKMYQELYEKYQKSKEDLQNRARIDRQDSVLVSNISTDKESVLSDSFSLPEELSELSAIKEKNTHFVNISEINFPQNAMLKQKQKVDLIENIPKEFESLDESIFIIQRQRNDLKSDEQQFEDMRIVPPLYENRIPTLYEKTFSSIMSQLSTLPPQKQWAFLNMVSFWTESKMQKLSDSQDDYR